MSSRRPLQIALIALLLGLIAPAFPAEAQTADSGAPPLGAELRGISQTDRSGDGRIDTTIIEASFYSPNDRVIVIDGGGDMAASSDWWTATDFHNDTWLFDAGGTNRAELVIRFWYDAARGMRRADIYHDRNGNGYVDLTLDGATVRIDEWDYPPFSLLTETDWTLTDGRVNWNITLETDGRWLDNGLWGELYEGIDVFELDGTPDYRLQFFDADMDGVPEYGVGSVLFDFPLDYALPRAAAWYNLTQTVPRQPQAPLFWHFLTSGTEESRGVDPRELPDNDLGKVRYFDLNPRMAMDWWRRNRPGFFFPGYPIEHGFHLNGNRRLLPDDIAVMNFELIQAYYDLAEDRDHNPELHIRHRFFANGDPGGWAMPADLNEIRWSWNQTNRPGLSWDYKIGLAGRQSIDAVTQVGAFQYHAVTWEDIPSWVLSETWDIATFISVERDHPPYISSEGIYPWGPIETAVDEDPTILSRYLSGQVVVMSMANVFRKIDNGLRGEFKDNLNGLPYLYFSPLDAELHLVGAEGCVHQIDDARRITCGNLNRDDHLDQWRYLHEETVTREMVKVRDLLLYFDEAGMGIRRLPEDYALESFRTLPPITHEEWLALGALLEAHAHPFAAGDFAAMAARAPGEMLTISGAAFSDLSYADGVLTFIMTLPAGYTASAPVSFIALDGLPAGEYHVTYAEGRFDVRPATPPALTVRAALRELPSGVFFTDVRLEGTVTVENSGLATAPEYTLEVFAEPEGGDERDRTWLSLERVRVRGGQTLTYSYEWMPDQPGVWTLSAALTERDPEALVMEFRRLQLAPPSTWIAAASADIDLPALQPVDRHFFLTLNGQIPLEGIPLLLLWIVIGISALTLFGWIVIYLIRTYDHTARRDRAHRADAHSSGD